MWARRCFVPPQVAHRYRYAPLSVRGTRLINSKRPPHSHFRVSDLSPTSGNLACAEANESSCSGAFFPAVLSSHRKRACWYMRFAVLES
jgi:hypothetical protein